MSLHHGQLPTHIAYRTADFRPKTDILAKSVLVALDGITVVVILLVIEHRTPCRTGSGTAPPPAVLHPARSLLALSWLAPG